MGREGWALGRVQISDSSTSSGVQGFEVAGFGVESLGFEEKLQWLRARVMCSFSA